MYGSLRSAGRANMHAQLPQRMQRCNRHVAAHSISGLHRTRLPLHDDIVEAVQLEYSVHTDVSRQITHPQVAHVTCLAFL